MKRRFDTFDEFWPFYVGEHAHPLNRALHFVGTTGVLGCLAGAAFGRWWLLPCVPLVGYGFAWIGHFLVEKNRPATFQHPFYSLWGDFVMWKKTVIGKMGDEVKQLPPR